MTDLETKRLKKFRNSLEYGRGLPVSDWPELIELRKKWLIELGEDPSHYNLDSRYCEKKIQFRTL